MSRKSLAIVCLLAVTATSGWVHAYRVQGAPQKFVQSLDRHSSAVLLFGANSLLGDLRVSHGAPVWKEQYRKQVKNSDQIPDGTRFRFGNNFWSTLETNVDLLIGGAKIPAGYYYLSYEKAGKSVNLVAFDAAEMRKAKLGSWQPPQTGGTVIPMELEETDDLEEELACNFYVDNSSGDISLEVAWGPFVLSAAVEIATRDQG